MAEPSKGNELSDLVPTLNVEQIQGIFNMTKEGIKKSTQLLHITAFYLQVKPIVDMSDWTIDWGMGSVSIDNRKGKRIDMDDSYLYRTLLKNLEELFEDFPFISSNGIFWDVMIGLGDYNRYDKRTGLVLITSNY